MELEKYLSVVEKKVGREADFFYTYNNGSDPEIRVFGFDDYPENGRFTYFSYGLHKLDKPEWKVGRPEYFLTIDSDNREFAMFLAYLLSVFSTEKIMSWNTLIGISDGDAIEGFPYRRMALGMPLYLNWEPYKLEPDNELPINFGMAFLISNSDFELAKDRGFSFLTDKLDEDQDYWWKIKRT